MRMPKDAYVTVSALSARRRDLTAFEKCYAVACQLRDTTCASHFVVRTDNPLQPFRASQHPPSEPETILALIA